MKNKTIYAFLIAALLCAGCNKQENAAQLPKSNDTQMASHGDHQFEQALAPQNETFKGKVTQTMNAGGYTYVAINQDGKEVWGAVEETPITVGDDVEYAIDVVMDNFTSKNLKRTFTKICFLKSLSPAANPGTTMPANHPSLPGNYSMNQTSKPATAIAVAPGSIPKASNGHTIAEIYSKRAELAGKPLQVRGKVVKSALNIMGSNWIHIRDGSAADGQDDLTITTKDKAAIGDVIFVTGGTLAVDKDFGANYKYVVILENAALKVE